jgi:hypothetical protein
VIELHILPIDENEEWTRNFIKVSIFVELASNRAARWYSFIPKI